MLRQVDSSLLEEWEKMQDPDYRPLGAGAELRPPRPEEAPDVTRDTKAFTASIRTRIFTFLRAWSNGQEADALEALETDGSEERLRASREHYLKEHHALRLDPEARNLRHTHVSPSDDGLTWKVEQMLVDVEGLNDWVLETEVDLEASRKEEEPVLRLVRLESLVRE
jgi:hypothetical protein